MIGALIVLTPTVGWAIPLLWPFLLSTAGAMGYKAYTSQADDAALRGKLTREMNALQIVTLPLDRVIQDVVSDEVGREEVLRFSKDDIVLLFKRDVRGKFAIQVMGPESRTRLELEQIGMEFATTLVQQFAYNRIAQEMERRGANVVSEEVNENGDIVLKLRRWE